MAISLAPKEISHQNLMKIISLEVSTDQQGYVAPNSITISQNIFEPGGWVRGLWDDDTPIGLIAMIDPTIKGPGSEPDDPQDAAYLWRLMIDHTHQRKGYGHLAIAIAFQQAQTWGFGKLLTSCVPGARTPQPFYESLGLCPKGRMVDGEVELVGPVPPA